MKNLKVKFENSEKAISKALEIGGKRWKKNGMDRVYLNNTPYIDKLYLDCNTGEMIGTPNFDGYRNNLEFQKWFGISVDEFALEYNIIF